MKSTNPQMPVSAASRVHPWPDWLRPGIAFPRRQYVRWVECAFWVAGVVALSWFFFVHLDTRVFQARQERAFDSLRHTGRDGLATELHPGDVIGKLTIPRIDLSAVVLEGDDEKTLRRAIGHIPGTSLVNGVGTVGLAGHRDTFFRRVGALHQDDVIVFETGAATYRYRVAETAIVEPQDVDVLQPTDRRALVLVTCYPFHFVGPAPRRFVVTAWQIPDGLPASLVHDRKTIVGADDYDNEN
jgi:sortase A